MARISDLISRDGASDGMSGVGANLWYAEVANPAPVNPGDDLYVNIPDLNVFGGDYKFGPIAWGGKLIPALGTPLLVAFDNRQQMWAVLDIADHTIPPVTSVFGRTGAIVKNTGDYAVADVTGAAPLANPVFTGDPQAPTPAPGDNDQSVATTQFVHGIVAASSGGVPPTRRVIVSGSGTYTLPTGCTAIYVECVGGGATGGQSQTGSANAYAAGAGGWGGSYAAKLIPSPLSSYAYSVGAGGAAISGGTASSNNGGDSTFGSSVVVAKGGKGGTVDQNSPGSEGVPHAIGVGTGQSGDIGDVIAAGGMPGQGWVQSSTWLLGGRGGNGAGPYGGPGAQECWSAGGSGGGNAPSDNVPDAAYGAGSSGSVSGPFAGASQNVKAGAGGIIVITEYYGNATPTGVSFSSGPFSGGPPASPHDGDIWIATGVDANGTVWQFRYNAGSASVYKWEFVGGAPLIFPTPNGNGLAAAAWNDIGGGYTVVRAGDYICTATMSGVNNTIAQTFEIGIGVGSTTTVNRILSYLTIPVSSDYTLSGTDRVNGVAVSTILWLNGYTSSGSGAGPPAAAQMTVIPVRIS